MSGKYFTEAEIDNILEDVEKTMQNAVNLSKNASFDDSEGEEDAPAAAPAAPDTGAEASHEIGTEGEEQPGGDPAMGAEDGMEMEDPAMGAEDGMEMEDPAMGAEDGMEMGDEQLAHDDGHMSDEELQQIYSSMDPSDLEHHYMIIRSLLRDAYAKMELGKTEVSSKPNQSNEEVEDVAKTEELEKKIKELSADNTEMKKSLEAALQAVEIIAKPERKAVTQNVQVLGKGEGDFQGEGGSQVTDYDKLSKKELAEELNKKVRDPQLSKSDRDVINGYLLRDEGKEDVIKLLGSK